MRFQPVVTMPNRNNRTVCEGQAVGEDGDFMKVEVESHDRPNYRWAYLDERNESGVATLRPFSSHIKSTIYNGPVAFDGRLWTVLPEPTDENVCECVGVPFLK